MIKQPRIEEKDYVIENNKDETPNDSQGQSFTVLVCGVHREEQCPQQTLKQKIMHNPITLSCKQQVKSLCSNSSQLSPKQSIKHSDDMDIDEENDIVNDLSYIEELDKAEQQDQLLATLSAKDRILYANSKKHQGNQCFRQNNLQDAIEAYKVGLSLLKPQSFMNAAASDCLAMAQLTSNILFNMGTCYFILMSCRYAIKFYDQAILIKPNYTKAIHNRALCHLQQSNLLAAFNDIKLAYQLDRHNTSIQADYKRIEVEYCRVYRHHASERQGLGVGEDLRVMSKSMIAEPTTVVSQFNVENDVNEEMGKGDTSASVIFEGQANSKIGQMTSLEQKARQVKEETSQTQSQKLTRQKIRSFYGNRFYKKNQVKCNKPWMKQLQRPILPSCMGSPKFRPYILNSTAKQPICQKKQPKFPDPKPLDLQNSAGELFQRQRRINLLKDKIHTIQRKDNTQRRNNTEEGEREKIRKRRSREKSREGKDQDKFWGYIPIVVATGFGLYHSLRAVLGK